MTTKSVERGWVTTRSVECGWVITKSDEHGWVTIKSAERGWGTIKNVECGWGDHYWCKIPVVEKHAGNASEEKENSKLKKETFFK